MAARKSELRTVRLSEIKSNPHRRLGDYPIDRRKVEALRRSIDQVGFWEGVIVRRAPDGSGYECAFGHHRLKAAEEELGKDKRVTVIVRDLDDGMMLQLMGRENAEDQRGNFLVMLETWEAAVRHLTNGSGVQPTAIQVGKFLGWTVTLSERAKRSGELQLTCTGFACNAAHRLLQRGSIQRDIFKDLSVQNARDLAQTLLTEIDSVKSRADSKESERALITAAESVAHDIRYNDRKPQGPAIKSTIRAKAYKKKYIPDLPVALNAMYRQVRAWHADTFESKLFDLCSVISEFRADMSKDDLNLCRYLRKDLMSVIERCQDSVDRIDRALDEGASARIAVHTTPSNRWLGGQSNDVAKEDPVP